jgi:hypothetical protein
MKWGLRLLGCAIAGVALLFVLAGTFWLGTRIGAIQAAHPASSTSRTRSPAGLPFPPFGLRPRPHGAVGSIVRIEDDNIVIQGRFGTEQTVHVTADTLIERGEQTVTLSDLQPGEALIVIGAPGADGTLEARFIGVLQPRSDFGSDREERHNLLYPIQPSIVCPSIE